MRTLLSEKVPGKAKSTRKQREEVIPKTNGRMGRKRYVKMRDPLIPSPSTSQKEV